MAAMSAAESSLPMALAPRRRPLALLIIALCVGDSAGALLAPAAAVCRPAAAPLASRGGGCTCGGTVCNCGGGRSPAPLPLPRPPPRRAARGGAPALKERELISLADEAEYNACVQAAKDENKVVVIKFFASWCRACKAMAPKISRVAEDWPDIEFYEIMFDDNKKLCKSLGIKILPFVEIIAGTAGKVESFSCGPSKISQLQARARARRAAAPSTIITAPTHRAPTNTAQAKLEVHGGCEMIPCTDVSAVLENL